HRIARQSIGPAKLDDAVAPRPAEAMHARAADQLRAMLASYPAPIVEPMIQVLLEYLRREQSMLACAAEIQAAINRVLERPDARRLPNIYAALSMSDYHTVRRDWFPYVFRTLRQVLGISIEHTADEIHVVAHPRAAEPPAPTLPLTSE